MPESVVINLVSDDGDSLTGTESDNENEKCHTEICHTEICLAMK